MSLMLYRRGGDTDIHGVNCDTRVVETAGEEEAARAEGFGNYGEMIAGEAVAPADDRLDLQAAAEMLEEERQAHAVTKTALEAADDRIADLEAQIADPDAEQGDDGLVSARADYTAKFDKKPYHGWDEAELRRRIAEAEDEAGGEA